MQGAFVINYFTLLYLPFTYHTNAEMRWKNGMEPEDCFGHHFFNNGSGITRLQVYLNWYKIM